MKDDKKIPSRLLSLAYSSLWIMETEALDVVLSILERENESVEAVEARLGRKLENTRAVTVRDGVAMIPVVGPIARYASMFDDISGATSIQNLATDFTTALNDPSVKGIVFTFDSPGGQVDGTSELADMIYAARGQKPMAGFVERAASGAYWLAAALPYLEIADTAHAGNIGVRIVADNPDAKSGPPRKIEVVNDDSPLKGATAATDDGKTLMRRYANETFNVFANKVAKYRGVTREHVVQNFGRGANRIGQDAVNAGMANGVGSLEGLVSKMKAGAIPATTGAAMKIEETMTGSSSTTLAGEAVAHANSLIDAGKVDRSSPWSMSPDDENKILGNPPDWSAYGKWFLGRDPKANTKTKEAYKYPYGKNGKVYRSGLIAAKDRAAVQGEKEIVNAASALLDKINKKSAGGNAMDPIETMTEEQLRDEIRRERQRREVSEKEAKKTAANAKIDSFVTDGRLSGKSEERGRAILVSLASGETVSAEAFEQFVESLPKLDTTRVAENAQQRGGSGTVVTLDDFAKAATSTECSKKIQTAVMERRKTSPKFTSQTLERELRAAANR